MKTKASPEVIRRFQIGVMGSMADLAYSKEFEKAAEQLGEFVAKRNGILIFGAEKDADSLSTAACRGAKRSGGLTVGVTYGKHKNITQQDADVIIPCGLERGGGREFVLVLGCDAIIAISGGSGTLNELSVAYQADIPMIALTGFGGWADKLAGEFFDARERRRVLPARSPDEAVGIAFREAEKYRDKYA